MRTTLQTQPKYRADIDGLRALAVLSVVIFHAFPTALPGGFAGVDVFFVISGYLISGILFDQLDKGTFSFADFYIRRIKRIFPALLIVLFVTGTAGWFLLLADEYQQLGKHIAAGAGFLANFALWSEAGYFDGSGDSKPLLHLWSLGIEEQFYIFWPPLLLALWRWKRYLTSTLFALFVLSLAICVTQTGSNEVAAFYSPLSRAWELLVGALLSWHLRTRGVATLMPTWANTSSTVGTVFLLYSFLCFHKGIGFPGLWPLLPTIGTALILAAGPSAWINRTVLSHKLAVWFGLISFPLYLWHWPLLAFPHIIESGQPSTEVRIVAVCFSILLSWLTYRFIETPVRWGQNTLAKIVALLFLWGLTILAGGTIYLQEGLPERSNIKNYANNTNELLRLPDTDHECFKYIGTASPSFPYCRFANAQSKDTIAVVGDSHAHVAYPGIADYLRTKSINTVLLGNSGCPPLKDHPFEKNDLERAKCSTRINDILTTLTSKSDIRKVFLFMRGPIYIDGTEPSTGSTLHLEPTSAEHYGYGLQKTIDTLNSNGKKVFVVLENPELSKPASACLPRPMRPVAHDCQPSTASVLQRQSAYRAMIANIVGAKIIDPIPVFCPGKSCIVVDPLGRLLYADDDHLSVSGSQFQVQQLLEGYLSP